MPRTYTSDVRAERSRRTRAAVVDAAYAMFLAEGWAATTMARVATASGVARQTVYLLFDGKLALLDACIDSALAAGAGVAVRELPDYRLMAEGDVDTRITAGARWLAGAHERSARIQRVLDEAAVTDPVAAGRLVERERNRWQEVRFALTLVLCRDDPPAAVVDAVWNAASRDGWLRLVGTRGWTSSEWQRWFAATVSLYREHAADAAGHGGG